MSTFCMVVNLDKRERMDLGDLGGTPKLLMTQAVNSREFGAGLMILLSEHWKGDRIALVDEHADLYWEARDWPSAWPRVEFQAELITMPDEPADDT
jgi:hypothetical protein